MQFCSLFVLGQNKTRNYVLDRAATFFLQKKFHKSHKRKEIMINNVLDRKENFFGEN